MTRDNHALWLDNEMKKEVKNVESRFICEVIL